MIPYFILFFLIVVFSFFGIYFKSKIFLILNSVIFAFFSGFRYNVGVDYPNYVSIFNGDVGYLAKELGFAYFVDFIHYIGGTYQLMFLILAIIVQFFVYKVIVYYSPNVWFSCLIFMCVAPFYLSTFNGTRQYIAISIFLYSLRFIDNKEYFRYVIVNLFGVFFFHQSLLFIALLFPLLRATLSIRYRFFIIFGLILINLLLDIIISYTPYINYLMQEDKEFEISTVTYLMFIVILPFVIFDYKFNDFKHRTVLLNLNFFCLITLLMVFIQKMDILKQMFLRLNSYFFFSYIILIPAIIYSVKNKTIRLFSYILISVCVILYFLSAIVLKGENQALVPYNMNFVLFN